MVAPEQEEVLGVLDFVAEEQANSLDGLFAAIDVVTQEQVVSLGREASVLENPQQVIVLAVHIAYRNIGLD